MLNKRCERTFREFHQDTSGSVTSFTVVSLLMMVLFSGMAVDFMRQEAMRAELQDAVDRGVLAAASLTQTMSPEDTIRGYLRSTSFVGATATVDAQELPGGINSRHITASVDYSVPTFFLKLVGISEMPIQVSGAAIESRQDIELSLVLDVSTSMTFCKSGEAPTASNYCDYEEEMASGERRIEVLRSAASNFINQMLDEDTEDYLTISLVPFAGQVDPGQVAFDHLSNGTVHPYSHCLEFSSSQLGTATMPSAGSLDQMQYFSFSSYYTNSDLHESVADGWCPDKDSGEEIVFHSNDAALLKSRIENLKTHEATGAQYGAKWGALLLDPSSIGLTSALITSGDVESEFSGRPTAYNGDTLKVMVVMTDGRTTSQRRMYSSSYDSSWEREWFAENPGYGWQYDWTKYSTTTARTQFTSVCSAAKANGVLVFSIGFDIDADDTTGGGADAHADLSACASSASHYYDVDGAELSSAFSAIAATIEKLKLIF